MRRRRRRLLPIGKNPLSMYIHATFALLVRLTYFAAKHQVSTFILDPQEVERKDVSLIFS